MPSVRGRARVRVVTVLAVAAAGSGALAGFGLGVLGLAAPELEPWAAAGVVVAALVFDVLGVRPFAVRRQVPRTWTRVFGASAAALLYGARLGVGPLTLLNTWLWWAAAVLGATAGVWWSALVGVGFGIVRVGVMVAAVHGREADMPGRMAFVRGREPGLRRATLLVGAVAAVALLAGCTDAPEERGAAVSSTSTTTSTTAVSPALVPDELVPGYARVPDDARPGLGPLDLDAAARVEADTSAERSVLATRRFRGGLARAWRSPEGDELYTAVYEFADDAGAAAYLQDGLVTLEGRAAEVYPVEGLPGATGFSQAERRAAGAVTSHGVVFARGPRFHLVVVASARPGTTPTLAADAARRLSG